MSRQSQTGVTRRAQQSRKNGLQSARTADALAFSPAGSQGRATKGEEVTARTPGHFSFKYRAVINVPAILVGGGGFRFSEVSRHHLFV
jgi:hypothetical protein